MKALWLLNWKVHEELYHKKNNTIPTRNVSQFQIIT